MNRWLLILLVGLPRSGKSTWARAQELPVVCPDAVRLALHGERFLGAAEPWVWLTVYTMARALFLAGHEAVIVDATNTTAKRRGEWAAQFPVAEVRLHVIGTDPDTCKERALANGMPDLLPVIDRMAAQWDLPRPSTWPRPTEDGR
jgi:predicted kinase